MKLRYFSLGLLFLSVSARAGGFQSGPQSARTLGMGGASVAYIHDLASMYYNPGALAQQDSAFRLSVGFSGSVRPGTFLDNNTRQLTRKDAQLLPGGYFYAARPVGERLVVGLSVNTPYGYDTRWPIDWAGRSVVQSARLNTVFVQPTASYRLNDNFSLGAGLVYAFGRMSQRYVLGQYDDPNITAQFSGTGRGLGFNVGIYGKTADALAFGISYRSAVALDVKNGTAKFTNVPALDAARYPASAKLTTKLRTPGALSVGLADQMSKKLLVTFDFTLTAWSSYDSLSYSLDGAPALATRTAGRRYEDAMAFRAGGQYRYSDLLTLRAGLGYEETPIRDEYISPDLPDGNQLGGSLGLSLGLSDNLTADVAYQFAYVGDRTSRANVSRTSINAVSGTFRNRVHSAALGLSYSF